MKRVVVIAIALLVIVATALGVYLNRHRVVKVFQEEPSRFRMGRIKKDEEFEYLELETYYKYSDSTLPVTIEELTKEYERESDFMSQKDLIGSGRTYPDVSYKKLREGVFITEHYCVVMGDYFPAVAMSSKLDLEIPVYLLDGNLVKVIAKEDRVIIQLYEDSEVERVMPLLAYSEQVKRLVGEYGLSFENDAFYAYDLSPEYREQLMKEDLGEFPFDIYSATEIGKELIKGGVR